MVAPGRNHADWLSPTEKRSASSGVTFETKAALWQIVTDNVNFISLDDRRVIKGEDSFEMNHAISNFLNQLA